MNITHELFYGKIDPNGNCCNDNDNYQTAIQTVSELEEIIIKNLEGELKTIFIKYENAYSTLLGESTIAHFDMDFKIGARFGIEIMSDDINDCIKD